MAETSEPRDADSPPPPIAGAEVFLRTSFRERTVLDCSDESDEASPDEASPGEGLIPGVYIYANRQGYSWLAGLFAWLAARDVSPFAGGPDPGCPVAIYDLPDAPWVYDLSDHLDLEFETLCDENRDAILQATGFTRENRKLGSPVRQFQTTAARLIRHVKRFGAEDAEECYGQLLSEMRELRRILDEGLSDIAKLTAGGPDSESGTTDC